MKLESGPIQPPFEKDKKKEEQSLNAEEQDALISQGFTRKEIEEEEKRLENENKRYSKPKKDKEPLLNSVVEKIKMRTGEKFEDVKERLSQKLSKFKGGVEKGVEKFREKTKAPQRAEKRYERLKDWEQLTQEERLEKYGKRFERAEKLYAFEKARLNLVELEELHNRQNSPIGKIFRKISTGKKELFKDVEEYYEVVLIEYKKRRAELVGANVWSALNEKMRVAEQEALLHQDGIFEKLREKWRALGEMNLEGLLEKSKLPKNKITKVLARVASLRTVASLGLLGGGAVIGFGSAVGIATLATRRIMGGASAAFGSYDLMSQIREKQDISFDEGELEGMAQSELEEKMTAFEARAKLSGERLVHDDSYNLLRKEYAKRSESSDKTVQDALQYLDDILREKRVEVIKEEKHRKSAAIGVGLFSIGAFSSSALTKLLAEKPEFSGITPDQLWSAMDNAPILLADSTQNIVDAEAVLPAEIFGRADSVSVSDFVAEALNIPEEGRELIYGTVKAGSSAWATALEMVDSGEITQEQFSDAWSSTASLVELPSGSAVHISELGLTHAGDQVVYIPETAGAPAHFEVVDYAEDALRMGSNEDLAAAFESEGKELPRWLKESIEAENAPIEIPEPSDVEISLEKLLNLDFGPEEPVPILEGAISYEEMLQEASEAGLELGDQIYELSGGTARFVLNESGEIADVQFSDKLLEETKRGLLWFSHYEGMEYQGGSLFRRAELFQKAAAEYLQPDYESVLELRSPEPAQELMTATQTAEVEGRAWKLFQLNELLGKLSAGSRESEFIKFRISSLSEENKRLFGNNIFK